MNISLTPAQTEYVRRTVARDFGNASEFFRNLLRERMSREIEADLALLQSTTPGAPAGPCEQEIEAVLATQRAVRKGLRHNASREFTHAEYEVEIYLETFWHTSGTSCGCARILPGQNEPVLRENPSVHARRNGVPKPRTASWPPSMNSSPRIAYPPCPRAGGASRACPWRHC